LFSATRFRFAPSTPLIVGRGTPRFFACSSQFPQSLFQFFRRSPRVILIFLLGSAVFTPCSSLYSCAVFFPAVVFPGAGSSASVSFLRETCLFDGSLRPRCHSGYRRSLFPPQPGLLVFLPSSSALPRLGVLPSTCLVSVCARPEADWARSCNYFLSKSLF